MSNNKKINILECTLRDGSYVIDYQFTMEDAYIICLGLARAGFKFIEIGHGLGMGSFPKRKGFAAASDKEYLQAAKAALSGFDSKFGMFFIPGIGSLDDLQLAADCGMDFVRVGTNVKEITKAAPYIKKAKELGFIVSSNLMKSYAVTNDEFKAYGKMANDFGVDMISVVDSAGGMMPDDVRGYIEALRSVSTKDIGFHGHNNLQLAMANTIAAVEAGAVFVDSSLQGMGRSAGNTQTEVLVMLLEKMGYNTGINPYDVMDMGKRIVKTMMYKEQGIDDISLVSGIAQFHSSFMDIINETAKRYLVDPRLLIIEVSKVDKVNVEREMVETTAQMIASRQDQKQGSRPEVRVDKNIVFRQTFENVADKAKAILNELVSLSKKTGKESVFSLTISKRAQEIMAFIRQSSSLVIANVEAQDLQEIEMILSDIDGKVDWVLLDESCVLLRESTHDKMVKKSRLAWYSEERVLLSGLSAFISQKSLKGKILVFADQDLGELVTLQLRQQGISAVIVSGGDRLFFAQQMEGGGVSAIVSFDQEFCSFLNGESVRSVKKDVLICCARPGVFPGEFWKEILKTGSMVFRLDARAALASELSLVIDTNKHIGIMGSRIIDGVKVVSGGVIGTKGSIILDSSSHPRKVIGVCNGAGGLLSSQQETSYKEDIEKVRAWIIRNLYQ
jgi:4-hydroxy 2-oxovalerate aldolase